MASSIIASARYYPDERALELGFTSGRRYLYLGVDREIAEALAAAPSKGTYFNDCIKGRFVCRELAPAAA